jgi:hypothetical protein
MAEDKSKETEFKVVSPLGEVTVEDIPMSPRSDTLDGKTVCMVANRSFKSTTTLPVIAELLLKKYHKAKVVPYTELPTSFKAPAPGITTPQREALVAAYKEKGCDAVVSGNGG